MQEEKKTTPGVPVQELSEELINLTESEMTTDEITICQLSKENMKKRIFQKLSSIISILEELYDETEQYGQIHFNKIGMFKLKRIKKILERTKAKLINFQVYKDQ